MTYTEVEQRPRVCNTRYTREKTVQYVDVIGLYPYVCKYFKFPVGHPVIHVGDACRDKEAILQKEGLVKC